MRNFVYQFAIVPNGNNKFGLIFSEESESYNSPIFAVSTRNNLYDSNFRFPGEINGEYQEFELTASEYGLKLNTKFSENNSLLFTYSLFPEDDYIFFRRRFMKAPFYPFYRLQYIGKRNDIIPKNEEFQVIIPRDLITMDRLFKEQKFCLVGYTPTFSGNNQ